MTEAREGLTRAILETYAQLAAAFWPALHPDVTEQAGRWASQSEGQLQQELDGYVAGLSRPGCPIGLFWKLAPPAGVDAPRPDARLLYAGGSANFLADARVSSLEQLVGRNDFDPRFPWGAEGARFAADDRRVMKGREIVGYVARQVVDGAERWNWVAKAPIVAGDGTVCGVLALYETLDPEVGRKAYWEQITKADAEMV